ncbi:glycoside hydrolase family 2 protein [Promicromonospora aerolata]|uniref:beta-mannosidase n=1 Tax=Promicromonospora aerolata TaxID=195749 RepID=A0ABW4V577_9MICO
MTHLPPSFRPLHENWTLTAVDGPLPDTVAAALADAIPATVPGEAHLDLLAAGLIADPFDGDNEAAQQWIGDTSWRFATTFEWVPGDAERHDLVAHGLDTVATVELNGVVVATTQNMHRSYRWDVRELLREGSNTLTVTCAAPVPEALARAERDGVLPRTNHHEYNQLRKMACSFGWDWGIDVAGAGIWKPIGLEPWSAVRVASVRPLVDVDGATGVLTAHVEIERASGDDDVPVTVTVTSPTDDVTVAEGVVPAGVTTTVVEVRVPDADLWWPVGHGAQPLYGVDVSAGPGSWTGRVGFRTVNVDTADDEAGAPFALQVNGQTVLVRGVNWIPDHAFLTRVTRDRYERAIADALDGNINLLRVWGGGIYEDDELYDLADEAGILMWQDFLFACAAYSEDAAMWAEVEAEARENITRLSPHPALVIWNGNNENTWGRVDWGWGDRLAGRPWGDGYYTGLFPALLADLDPTRFYSPASPFSFGDYRHPNDDRFGTMHVWDVWNRADYTVYRDYRPRFVSEFGFQAPPAWSTLTRVVHDEPMDPFGHEMLVHQKAHLGNKKLERGWQGHLPDPRGIEDWHWATQLNQAQAVRFGIEHWRSLTPHNTGTILWQLNDNWPVVSWAAVDHDGHRKPLWHAVRAAYAPRLATIQPRASQDAEDNTWQGLVPEADSTTLVLVNDTASPFTGTFTATRQTFDGAVLATATLSAQVPARGTADVMLPTHVATFDDALREVVVVTPDTADSGFAPAFLDGADVVEQRLDPAPVKVTAAVADSGVALTITATSYVRDLMVLADKVDPAAHVTSGLVSLTAGQSVAIHVTTGSDVDPAAFAGTLRCANDLLG